MRTATLICIIALVIASITWAHTTDSVGLWLIMSVLTAIAMFWAYSWGLQLNSSQFAITGACLVLAIVIFIWILSSVLDVYLKYLIEEPYYAH